MKIKVCELCQGEASVHCASDSAFLCFGCDAKVHGANFLVARHVRRPICSRCGSLADVSFSGAAAGGGPAICTTCCVADGGLESESDRDSSSSSSSACISGTGSVVSAPRKRRARRDRKMNRISSSSSVTETAPEKARFSGKVDSAAKNGKGRNITSAARWPGAGGVYPKAEGVLIIWLRRLGLSDGEAVDRANRALGFCSGKFTIMPLRVLLAAAAWVSLRTSGDRRMPPRQVLRRLEEVSGVPARLILATESKLGRVNRAGAGGEEGWDECCPGPK